MLDYTFERRIELQKRATYKEAKQVGIAEGIETGKTLGRSEGRSEGALVKLTEQVCKKIEKSMTPEEIADIFEEDLPVVQKICEIAAKYAPNYDVDAIVKEYLEQ